MSILRLSFGKIPLLYQTIRSDAVHEVTSEIATYSPLVNGFWKLEDLHKTIELHDESPSELSSAAPDFLD
jgi:hypothetical protein